jgi:hypothetical protein
MPSLGDDLYRKEESCTESSVSARTAAGSERPSGSLFRDGESVRAKRSKSGRVWRITGRRMGEYRQLSPLGGDYGAGFGGVKAIWKTDDDLAARFERVA